MKSKFLFSYLCLCVFLLIGCQSDSSDIDTTGTPLLSSLQISNLSAKSVTISATIDSNGNLTITEKGFVYSTSANPTINDNIEIVNGSSSIGEFSATLNNLQVDRGYYVRAYAKNEAGISYSSQMSFTTSHNVFTGVVNLLTQSQVNEFGDQKYTLIDGRLNIGSLSTGTDISSLEKLSTIIEINGGLSIYGNQNLQTLKGLENIERVKFLDIQQAHGLTNIDGLSGLKIIDGTSNNGYIFSYLTDNDNLTNIDSFSNLEEFKGSFQIMLNEKLVNLNGFKNISSFEGSMIVKQNNSLQNTDGLTPIENAVTIEIASNPLITNVDGLINLNSLEGHLTIEGNDNLLNIDALTKLTNVSGSLGINSNDKLVNIDGLVNLVSVGTFLSISGNDIITEINGLTNIQTIGDQLYINFNNALTDISSLTKLTSAKRLNFRDNPLLSDFCSLTSFIVNSTSSIIIQSSGNAYNPFRPDFVNGNCKN